MSVYRNQLESWLRTIDVGPVSVLDIGGSANPVKGRVRSWNAKSYTILDNNNEQDFHDNFQKPDIVFDLNMADKRINKYLHKFDIIFMLEVLEYIYNPVNAIEYCWKLAKGSGVLYISYPFVYPQHQPVYSDFLRYTPEGIEHILSRCGFDVITNTLRHGDKSLVEYYAKDGLRMAKGYDHSIIGGMIKAIRR